MTDWPADFPTSVFQPFWVQNKLENAAHPLQHCKDDLVIWSPHSWGWRSREREWIENWGSGWVVMGGTKFSWQPVTDSVSQGSVLGLLAPALINIFFSDLDDEAGCPFDNSCC